MHTAHAHVHSATKISKSVIFHLSHNKIKIIIKIITIYNMKLVFTFFCNIVNNIHTVLQIIYKFVFNNPMWQHCIHPNLL